ncbi:MAG TPA: DNA-processing protein DprA [Polyangiaceae bacterium]
MLPLIRLTPLDRAYPSRLRSLPRPPAVLTLRGGPVEASTVVAVVGSRSATAAATAHARLLAATLVRAGAVVVSGGANGIDTAAHQGALHAGGRTWVVAGTGCEHCFPTENAALFDAVARGPGTMIWPFADARAARPGSFLARNRVLVALADAVVVVQAGLFSGALRAAEQAQAQRKTLWVVPAAPWMRGFEGSLLLLAQGVRPLSQTEELLRSLDLIPRVALPNAASPTDPHPNFAPLLAPLEDPIQIAVLRATSDRPRHLDEIATLSHTAVHSATAALLTLALQAVVVEGPPGFFRRSDCPNH